MIHEPEILEDILSRVPIKSIGRFRCVSKQWRTLLSQPQFIKTHLNRTKQSPFAKQSLILVNFQSNALFTTHLKSAHHMFDEMTATNLSFDDHSFDSAGIYIQHLASCDGLTLFTDDKKRLLLANPTTKEFKVLPKSPCTVPSIGYDSVSDDYKVVTLYVDFKGKGIFAREEVLVNVYSVKRGTWKRVVNSPYKHATGRLMSGVFVHGHIHWLAKRTSDYSPVIVAFDLAQEKFCELPPPSLFNGENFVYYLLLSLEGCLCMFGSSVFLPNEGRKTNLWVIKEYGVKASWTKILIVDPDLSYLRSLCLLGKEEVVFAKSNDERAFDEKLVIYNLKEESSKDIVIHGIPYKFGAVGTFMESLVSPHCIVEATREE